MMDLQKILLGITFSLAAGAFGQTKSISVDFNTNIGTGKKMTGVNTGPQSVVSGTTENCLRTIGNQLIRTHDYHGPCDYWGYASFFNYVTQKFDYSFKSYQTSGYNWTSTDAKVNAIVNAGFQPFFRVGISFPGGGTSPASPMPKDNDGINFTTFAGIAKRTAMHFTGAWNNGYNYAIPYWEIWNEPNNNASWTVDSVDAYYRLYKQCADSIKSFNSSLKVGGPAAAKNAFYTGGIKFTLNHKYVSNFLNYCKNNSIPLDFYSFHMYDKKNPYNLRILTDSLTYYLNKSGFTNTELVVSETNINTGGYDNTAKGCSHLTSELISLFNTRLNKFIWYRGVDLNPLCYSDNGSNPNLSLNGYAYKFYNELNDSTPNIMNSTGNEFNTSNVNDSLNNFMILSGKNSNNSKIKVLISNHESVYSAIDINLQNLPWNSTDNISVKVEKVSSSGYQSSTTNITGGSTLTFNLSAVSDATVYLITFDKNNPTSQIANYSQSGSSVFPNPANDRVRIKTRFENFDISIANTTGQEIIHQRNKSEIPLTSVPAGIYFVTLKGDTNYSEIFKLVITK